MELIIDTNDFHIMNSFCDSTFTNFTDTIKVFREHRGYTIDQFAEMCGLLRGSYSNIEKGISDPAVRTMIKIAYNLEVESLIVKMIAFSKKEHNENKIFQEILQLSDDIIIENSFHHNDRIVICATMDADIKYIYDETGTLQQK